MRAWDWKVWEGGTRDTGLVTVDNLFENPARYFWAVFWHINFLVRFRAPIADAIFFDVSVICFFQFFNIFTL